MGPGSNFRGRFREWNGFGKSTLAPFFRTLTLLALVGGGLVVALPANTWADPPPWTPAHGKRQKGEPYTGYSGKKWDTHYGVINGRCNRDAVGAVISAAAGGATDAQAGKGGSRTIAMLVGTSTAAGIGARIGRDIDQTDRACIAHSLELVGDKKRVTWLGADQRKTFRLTPLRGFEQQGVKCREFEFRVTTDDRKDSSKVRACPGSDGTWRLVG